MFGSIGVFSAGVGAGPGGSASDFESRFSALLADSSSANKKLSLFWIGCGRQDALFAGAQSLSEILTKHQIQHVFRATEGAHTWLVWRRYLAELLPLLFRQSS